MKQNDFRFSKPGEGPECPWTPPVNMPPISTGKRFVDLKRCTLIFVGRTVFILVLPLNTKIRRLRGKKKT